MPTPDPRKNPPPPPVPAKSRDDRRTSDTVTGINLRWKDNLFQAIFIYVFMMLGGAIGAAFNWFAYGTAVFFGLGVGVIAGLLLGTFLSGFALMLYRMRKPNNK